jgi:DNA replication and repair protein RecF
VRVAAVEVPALRSLSGVSVDLEDGVLSVVGPNGTGKTNLLEALHFALSGRSFRTTDRRELIPFGTGLGRAEAVVHGDDGAGHRFLASVSRSEGRRHLLDGAAVDPATAARHRPPLAVFSPDRLALVKGPPAERRAELDRFVAVRWPTRAELRQRFGRVLAQRNALLSRIAKGAAAPADLDAWDDAFASAAEPLIAARREAVSELAAPFAAAGGDLGLAGDPALRYAPRAEGDREEIREGLGERRETDLRLGRTSWGPHLDELALETGNRALRRYGSQGQQRLALLALLFAEREALVASGAVIPLLLLDDVMSELDADRRELLGKRLEAGGQTLITATEDDALPRFAREQVIAMPAASPRPRPAALAA